MDRLSDEEYRASFLRLSRVKPSGLLTIWRRMTPEELDDQRRGWAASALRRRATTGLGLGAADVDGPEAEDRCELVAA